MNRFGIEHPMYCTGSEQLFTDIIDQTVTEKHSALLEAADKTFDIKMVGKKLVKLNIKSGESWEWNYGTYCWEFMKMERPTNRSPYFAKR